jgi:hypothetical protein
MDKRYRFVGEGAGVPGLPHELSESEAWRLGVGGLLADALASGIYKEIGVERPKTPRSLTALRAGPQAAEPAGEE